MRTMRSWSVAVVLVLAFAAGAHASGSKTFKVHLDGYNLLPFFKGEAKEEYTKWVADRAFLVVPSQAIVGQWLASFKEFPIRQKPASFNLDAVREKLSPKQ